MSVVYFCVSRNHFFPYAITLLLIADSNTRDSLPIHLYCVLVVPAQNAHDTKTIVMSFCVNTLKFEH